ncbi:hypothetical protein [Streptomyces triticirhizae]|uniref:Uncharacterized protein n=1 Tax=Streptomyces triticirhizae TaxID=2483353 RepID=A0A3M2KVF8_9ACTN|nr:hypothetical protein [Streptomyces triticirhizae]RMI27475.1 hypothetical protein EBN88_29415 [Streptomyces triticirhizae]
MVRNTLGAVLALIAAVVGIGSVFFDWYGGRDGRNYRWWDLFNGAGVTGGTPALIAGLFLPMLVAAALAVAGILLRSRLLTALSGAAILGFTLLWMIRQYNTTDSLTIGQGGMSWPVLAALGSGLLMLYAATTMAGRHLADRGLRGHGHGKHREETGGEVRQGPWRKRHEEHAAHGEHEEHGRRDVA